MSTEEGVPGAVVGRGATTRLPAGVVRWLATFVVWGAGSAIVALAQPDSDRSWAAAAAAGAGVGTILVLTWLTGDPGRRYFRSLLGGIVAASLTADATLQLLASNGVVGVYFGANGIEERITLPLIVVLLAPLVLSQLWARRAQLRRRPRPLDAIFAAYATVVAVPALLVGLAHHNHLSYIAQDLGLVVFFVFAYLAGRLVATEAARASAREFVDILLAIAVAQLVLLGWEPSPLYPYVGAACTAAIAFAVLQPRGRGWFLACAVGVIILATDIVAIHDGTTSSITIELLGAVAVLGYLLIRLRPLVPQWLIVVAGVAALAVFLGFTGDGRTLRGQYHGPDPSNAGRTYEAARVRAEVRRSPLSLVLGRGFGGTINETHAPVAFRHSLVSAGRNLAQVQEIHLLPYSFLLKDGFLGIAWLLSFLIGLVVVALRALDRAARERDPTFVIYAALPVLAVAQALSAASHLQVNPLTSLALGVLVTMLAAPGRERGTSPHPE